jgi:GT2 family glycosyltransferase
VVVSRGNGSLFWTGGMNLSWELAMKSDDYDGYLWLNDDTVPIDGIWHRFIEAHNYCIATYGKGGIYVGSTLDKQGEKHTYGGSRSVSRWKGKFQMVKPNGEFQKCDIAHGNITLISKDVADKLGCLYKGYAHGYGDYDYSLAATRKGFPVLILKDYVGYCDNDHKHLRDILISKKSLKERIKYLYAPTGMDLSSRLLYQWRFYPHYYLLTLTAYWVRAIFPQIIGKDTI